jgi:tetrahydromethanopterin S-methyltransferase subunit H
MNLGMQSTEGNTFVLNILHNIKSSGLKDRDAVKQLFDHLDHLSDSTFFRESQDEKVKLAAIKWLEDNGIVKAKILDYISL